MINYSVLSWSSNKKMYIRW